MLDGLGGTIRGRQDRKLNGLQASQSVLASGTNQQIRQLITKPGGPGGRIDTEQENPLMDIDDATVHHALYIQAGRQPLLQLLQATTALDQTIKRGIFLVLQ